MPEDTTNHEESQEGLKKEVGELAARLSSIIGSEEPLDATTLHLLMTACSLSAAETNQDVEQLFGPVAQWAHNTKVSNNMLVALTTGRVMVLVNNGKLYFVPSNNAQLSKFYETLGVRSAG